MGIRDSQQPRQSRNATSTPCGNTAEVPPGLDPCCLDLGFEDRCEDYRQLATDCGSLPQAPHAFELDDHHRFETRRPLRVCGSTFDVLASTRYAPHFELIGDKRMHSGLFDCAPCATAAAAAQGSQLLLRRRVRSRRLRPRSMGADRPQRAARWLTATLPRISTPASSIGRVTGSSSSHQAQLTANSGIR